jgi:hypothetical protein
MLHWRCNLRERTGTLRSNSAPGTEGIQAGQKSIKRRIAGVRTWGDQRAVVRETLKRVKISRKLTKNETKNRSDLDATGKNNKKCTTQTRLKKMLFPLRFQQDL